MVDDGSNMDASNRHTVYLDFATSVFFTSVMGKWWEMDANHLPYPRSCYCPKHWPQFVRKRHQTCLDISLFQRCFKVFMIWWNTFFVLLFWRMMIWIWMILSFDDLMIMMIGSEAHHPEELPPKPLSSPGPKRFGDSVWAWSRAWSVETWGLSENGVYLLAIDVGKMMINPYGFKSYYVSVMFQIWVGTLCAQFSLVAQITKWYTLM